jgi:hypothetical protein
MGIIMSSRIKFGFSAIAFSTASSPSLAETGTYPVVLLEDLIDRAYRDDLRQLKLSFARHRSELGLTYVEIKEWCRGRRKSVV